jgi:hypothetical protein
VLVQDRFRRIIGEVLGDNRVDRLVQGVHALMPEVVQMQRRANDHHQGEDHLRSSASYPVHEGSAGDPGRRLRSPIEFLVLYGGAEADGLAGRHRGFRLRGYEVCGDRELDSPIEPTVY